MKVISTELDPSASICVNSYGYEDDSFNAHWGRGSREKFIVHYVMEGEGFFNSCKVKSGEGFLITPGLLHEYHSSETQPWKYFWVIFSGKDAESVCKKYIDVDENGIFEYGEFELKLVDLINRIMVNSGRLTQARALGYFYMILSCHEPEGDITGNSYVDRAEEYMKTHIYRGITVTEIADAVGVSDRYLYNLFVKYRGISPKQYLIELKLARAKGLLKTTDDSVSEIAASTGFDDVLIFSRFFKKHAGISPTTFRRKYYK